MEVIVKIPDDIASRMTADGADLSRRALEGLALEEYKCGHITEPELRRLLSFGTRYQLDGFLKSHGIYSEYTVEDLELEREDLRRLGF
jgi:hypothetical protein